MGHDCLVYCGTYETANKICQLPTTSLITASSPSGAGVPKISLRICFSASGVGDTFTSSPVTDGATALVNSAISSTTALVVDNNRGTIEVGMTVTGTGISGSVTIATVTNQNTLVLSSAQSLSDDVVLTFTKGGVAEIGGSVITATENAIIAVFLFIREIFL